MDVKKFQPPRITPLIEKMEELEDGFKTLEVLFLEGCLSVGEKLQIGDWDLCTWDKNWDGSFSCSVMENARCENQPFPLHVHKQRLWIMCAKGILIVNTSQDRITLNAGDYVTLAPNEPHEIHAVPDSKTVALLVTIPTDPGLHIGNSAI